ncbi:MAG: septal ring lytic transglycosylase RlpA family protein [Vampirovibrionales bacterium]|nr:septal ring lytic transglycosylase RlpA family protein [Vampirovibrionales bacterium]
MATLSPIFSLTSNTLSKPSNRFSQPASKTPGLGYGAVAFSALICLSVLLGTFSAFAEEPVQTLPDMPSINSVQPAAESMVAMPAVAVAAPLARQHWVVAIPGGVPASQPLDTPQRWVLRVVPNAADGSDASVILGTQELLRYRSSMNGQTAYERSLASVASLKTIIEKASTPQQLRNSLKVSVLGGQPVLMLGAEVMATADSATAQQAQMPPAQLASVWHGYFHKAFTPTWELYTPLPKTPVKPAAPAKPSVAMPAKTVAPIKSVAKPAGKPAIKTSLASSQAKAVVTKTIAPAKPFMPEAITAPEKTPAVSVSTTRQAILAQIMAQQAAVEADSNSVASSDTTSTVIVLPAKAFVKKDFQTAPRLGEPTANLFKALETPSVVQTGMASWYGDQFHGRRTSSGQRFDMHGYTAAHRTLPFGTKLRVTNLANGRSVMVTVNDRGPFGHGRIIDLSKAAARDIGLMSMGVARVSLAKMPKFSPKLSPKLLPKKLAMLP